MTILRRAHSLALVVAWLIASGQAAAQGWPSRPIRWIVPFAPGGAADLISRAVAQKLSEGLGQQVVVDNRTGAGGAIGIDAVAKSAPDGHTIAIGAAGPISIIVHMSKLPYDPVKDLTPVAKLAIVPIVIAANRSQPFANLRELISYAKANPGRLSFGSAGTGSVQHLGGELLKSVAGIDMVHVPYKGSGPAAADLAGGQIPLAVVDVTSTLPFMRAGRVRALAVTGAARTITAPDVPTAAESGLPGFDVEAWLGLFGPAGLPAEIVARLNAEVRRALQTTEVRERALTSGAEPAPSSAEEFAKLVRNEYARWGQVIRTANIKPE